MEVDYSLILDKYLEEMYFSLAKTGLPILISNFLFEYHINYPSFSPNMLFKLFEEKHLTPYKIFIEPNIMRNYYFYFDINDRFKLELWMAKYRKDKKLIC